ncbi:hypothetical protein SNE40_006881 [Patella caerulea]|uniref:Uncharacterized protein n=1 Tax=Patella caerulea TaxID=87958 RepID=A0AAN8JYG8_PATCE
MSVVLARRYKRQGKREWGKTVQDGCDVKTSLYHVSQWSNGCWENGLCAEVSSSAPVRRPSSTHRVAFGEWQESYDRFPYTYVKGLTDIDDVMSQVKGPQVLVVHDLMGEDTEILQKWFTKKSHYHDTSVIYIVQNLFDKQQRTISLNAHYLVLFKNPRDASQIGALARQMYPSRSKYMQEAYEDATSTPRSYLLVDLKPDTPEALRLRSNILPQEEPPIVYVQKV